MRVPRDEDFTSRRGRDTTGWADGLRNDGGQEGTPPRVYKDNTSWKRVVYRITRNTFPDVPMASSNRQRVAKEDRAWKREYYFKTKGPVPDAPMSSPNRDVKLVGRIHDVNTLTDSLGKSNSDNKDNVVTDFVKPSHAETMAIELTSAVPRKPGHAVTGIHTLEESEELSSAVFTPKFQHEQIHKDISSSEQGDIDNVDLSEVDPKAAFLSALLEYEKAVGAPIGSQPIRASYRDGYVDSQSLGDDGYGGMDPRPAVPDRPVVHNEQDEEDDEMFDDPVVDGDQFEGGIAHSDEEEGHYKELKEAFRSMKSEFYFIEKS